MKRAVALATLVGTCVLLGPSLARAHIRILSPTPRYDEDNGKNGPCGQGPDARGLNAVLVRSGSLLRLQWEETIAHPSHYRISFDVDGQDDLADPPEMQAYYSNDAVLVDALADEDDVGGIVTADIPLPDVECENCTLQLIQVMYDKPPYEVGGNDIYYACVDLTLRRDAPCSDLNVNVDAGPDGVTCGAAERDGGVVWPGDAGATPDPDDGAAGDGNDGSGGSSGGTNGGSYGGGGSGTPSSAGGDAGGCSLSTGSTSQPLWLGLLGLALARRRRRT